MTHTYTLIADSGSTKTNWVLLSEDKRTVERFTTSGINPFYQDQRAIVAYVNELDLKGKAPRKV
ncbi:MAG: hypothetical protein LC643_08865, partial [Bacteroidales bacterium]|nr:hypothetical protein [Bacteroidales bacterium]